MFTPPRLDTPELLDEHDAPRADMERSLRDLRRINRFLGGISTYRRLIRLFLPDRNAMAIVADLGAGTADLLDSLSDYPNLRTIAVDFNLNHLLYLRRGSRALRVVADAHNLPFRDATIDVITSSHFFHHFAPDDNVLIGREAARCARVGVIFTDTRRNYLPLLFIWLLGRLRLVGRITAFDGPASVRRGYTAAEARAIGERSGAARVAVVKLVPFRFGMLLWK